jgi:hypothetical protein
MATILIGIINPIALIGKARDSKRKEDLGKIKTSFEEYYNDKKSYPTADDILSWNVTSNCGKAVSGISNYLPVWLCDPTGQVYNMSSNGTSFRVVTNLDNKVDKDIPVDWYTSNMKYILIGFTKETANYGVSSSNIFWYDSISLSNCFKDRCSKMTGGHCDITNNCLPSDGQCFYAYGCDSNCISTCCGDCKQE